MLKKQAYILTKQINELIKAAFRIKNIVSIINDCAICHFEVFFNPKKVINIIFE